jgi:plastocyanin
MVAGRVYRSVRSFFTPLLILSAALTAAAPGGQTPNTGSVSGRVTLTRRIRGKALPSTAYPSRALRRSEAPATPEIRNVVVYLKDPAFRGALTPRRAEMKQASETFQPHVLAITKGSTVDFPNDDPYFHNVFSLSGAATFNLGRYPRSQTRSQTFAKPGIVKVFCQIHSQMSAAILVFDHPYFTVPALDGTFDLPNVPPGSYTVVGWHERVGERVETVVVEAGKAASIDLSLPVEEKP